MIPLGATYGSFGIRLLAYLVDQILLTVGMLGLSGAILLGVGLGGGFSQMDPQTLEVYLVRWFTFSGAFANLAYFAFFWGWCGQTPGKMLFRLRVIRPDGRPLTYSRALLRYLGYTLSFLPFGLGFLWILVDPRRRGLHDWVADTVVIREPRTSGLFLAQEEDAAGGLQGGGIRQGLF